ncbi:hypothetical protein COY27_03905 [Candidatus Woesearchaeota archaeon CG_4_10_14_0_2_um_filter_33_13]|nr:MAG: hypothetical protein COY27_03905 [Candidatus Woesearchaeota archaeon CG_4_10_14_0_2_um_filter_33_13]
MDKKKILINAAIVIFVPSLLAGAYYGYKAFKHYREKKKEGEEGNEEKSNLESNSSTHPPLGDNRGREAKIIPITQQIEQKEKLSNTGS